MLQLTIVHVDYKRKDPVYWIDFRTTIAKYTKKQQRIPRYYSELERLYQQLVSIAEDVLIPPLPPYPTPRFTKEGEIVRRQWWFTMRVQPLLEIPLSPLPLPAPETHHDDNDRLESDMQQWFDRILFHTSVQSSELLREFVESEAGFRPPKPKPQASRSTPHVPESAMEPDMFQWTDLLTRVRLGFEQCQPKAVRLVALQGDMAPVWDRLCASWIAYGSLERHPELFLRYKGIAKGCQQVLALEQTQGQATAETLGAQIDYQLHNVAAAEMAIQRRLHVLADFLSSQRQTESCLRGVERLRASTTIDRTRASEAIRDLDEARQVEQKCRQRYEHMNGRLRDDVEYQYQRWASTDVIRTIREYAKSQLYIEQQKLKIWQVIAEQDSPSSYTL